MKTFFGFPLFHIFLISVAFFCFIQTTSGETITKTIYPGGHVEDEDVEKKRQEKGVTELHQIAYTGNVASMKNLINSERKFDYNVQDGDGYAPLHLAAAGGHLEIAELLLKKGVDFDIKDKNGITPLHIAAQRGHDKIVRLLLQNGAEENEVGAKGFSPLYAAAQEGHIQVAEQLLKFGADVNKKGINGFAPLHAACLHGRVKMIEYLLKREADPNIQTDQKMTCLHMAVDSGNQQVLEILLRDPTQAGFASHVNLELKLESGATALQLAALKGKKDIARLLLDAGAYVDTKDSKNKGTALHRAAQEGFHSMMSMLIEQGADINHQDKNGFTALYIAAQQNHIKAVKLLLMRGANLSLANSGGFQPIHKTAQDGRLEMVELLLSKGADVNALSREGYTPLFLATVGKHKAVIRMLLGHKAKVNIQENTHKNSSFHAAGLHVDLEIFADMAKYGGNVNLKNAFGQVPLAVAFEAKILLSSFMSHPAIRLLFSPVANWSGSDFNLWLMKIAPDENTLYEACRVKDLDGAKLTKLFPETDEGEGEGEGEGKKAEGEKKKEQRGKEKDLGEICGLKKKHNQSVHHHFPHQHDQRGGQG